ncbi:MAG: hypothetical protein Q7T82_06630 [Armatimonadota bacterium]|nr:hypothetical protein [Armatimonadota bacterium]
MGKKKSNKGHSKGAGKQNPPAQGKGGAKGGSFGVTETSASRGGKKRR